MSKSPDQLARSAAPPKPEVESRVAIDSTLAGRLRTWKTLLRKELENYEILDVLEGQVGFSKLIIFVIAFGLYITSVFFGLTVQMLCAVLHYAFPAYSTIRCLHRSEKSEYRHWLTYWILLAFSNIMEELLLERLYPVFPFYHAFKLGFFIWCQSLQHRGSVFVYSQLLTPFLKRHSAVMPTM